MRSLFSISSVFASLVLTIPSIVHSADKLSLETLSFSQIKQDFKLVLSPSTLAKNTSVRDALVVIQQHKDANKVNHIRVQQRYAGFHVVGGEAILHTKQPLTAIAGTSANVSMNGSLYKALYNELGEPAANFVTNSKYVLENFIAPYAKFALQDTQVAPLIYIDKNNQAHWAYKVSVLVLPVGKMPERPTAIIDAVTQRPLVQWNDIKTIKIPNKALGFGGNTKTGKIAYGKEYPLLDIMRDKSLNKCYMENSEVRVVDMRNLEYSDNRTMTFPCLHNIILPPNTVLTGFKNDGYDRSNDAFSPSNDALYAGYVIKHLYQDWYHIEALVHRDNSPMQLIMRVHFGEDFENAYWDGQSMTFGDGGEDLYPLVSLGIAAHEISHGFTEQNANLAYYEQSGGMNESFSDMAAKAAEFYSTGHNDWVIGAEIMKESSGYEALRYMDIPSKDHWSIDSADEYDETMDVHFSSGVYNRLFYLMATTEKWDTRKAFDVMVKANMDYWLPFSTYQSGACGVLYATKDLGYSLDDVQHALEKVSINTDNCVV